MLHWIAGQRSPESDSDADATDHDDPPETPAPVFAYRAFKHAVFGTPQPSPNHRRSQSNQETHQLRSDYSKPFKPPLSRARSANDANARALEEPSSVPSPTKGILMTPGTAAARRKTVSFGEHVVNNESKRPLPAGKSGLPDGYPGKLASPLTQSAERPDFESNGSTRDVPRINGNPQSAREDPSRRRRYRDVRGQKDGPSDRRPDDETDTYERLKCEYDEYRANTNREVKKLVTKQRAAKSYAREKDEESTELRDQLRSEKKRADKFETRVADLEAELHAVRAELAEMQSRQQPAISRTRSSSGTHAGPRTQQDGESNATRDVHHAGEKPSDLRPVKKIAVGSEITNTNSRATLSRLRPKSEGQLQQRWTPTTSPSAENPQDCLPSPTAGRAVTSGTSATPLVSMSINTLAAASERHILQSSPTRERYKQQIPVPRQGMQERPTSEIRRRDSYDLAVSPEAAQIFKNPYEGIMGVKPSPSPESIAESSSMPPLPKSASVANAGEIAAKEELSAMNKTTAIAPIVIPIETKENVAPSKQWLPRRTEPVTEVQQPPQYAGAEEKRRVSREGREIAADRFAEIKARRAAERAQRQVNS